MDIADNYLKHVDLHKLYGEFNFHFEDTIQVCRFLTIELIRISYNYFEDEGDEERGLLYHEQDRLLKIMMNSMGANDIVANCKACFVDFFNQQKIKHDSYVFETYDGRKTISEHSFEFAKKVFNKTLKLVELRNIIIHSHYSESFVKYEISRKNLRGQRDIKTSEGYERRNYTYNTNLLEKINSQILRLLFLLQEVRILLSMPDMEHENYDKEIEELKSINFEIKYFSEQ